MPYALQSLDSASSSACQQQQLLCQFSLPQKPRADYDLRKAPMNQRSHIETQLVSFRDHKPVSESQLGYSP